MALQKQIETLNSRTLATFETTWGAEKTPSITRTSENSVRKIRETSTRYDYPLLPPPLRLAGVTEWLDGSAPHSPRRCFVTQTSSTSYI